VESQATYDHLTTGTSTPLEMYENTPAAWGASVMHPKYDMLARDNLLDQPQYATPFIGADVDVKDAEWGTFDSQCNGGGGGGGGGGGVVDGGEDGDVTGGIDVYTSGATIWAEAQAADIVYGDSFAQDIDADGDTGSSVRVDAASRGRFGVETSVDSDAYKLVADGIGSSRGSGIGSVARGGAHMSSPSAMSSPSEMYATFTSVKGAGTKTAVPRRASHSAQKTPRSHTEADGDKYTNLTEPHSWGFDDEGDC
jgi:hypothetical protein